MLEIICTIDFIQFWQRARLTEFYCITFKAMTLKPKPMSWVCYA